MRKSGKILLGLATIFAAGAAVGMLYAPDKGERTRHRITRKTRRLFNAVDDTIGETKDNIEELRDEVRDKLLKIDDEIQRLSKC